MRETRKRALIIGASRGLGLGFAKEFVARGWELIGTARDLDRAAPLSEFAEATGSRFRPWRGVSTNKRSILSMQAPAHRQRI